MIAINKHNKPRLPMERCRIRAAMKDRLEYGDTPEEALRVLADRWCVTVERVQLELIKLQRGPKPKPKTFKDAVRSKTGPAVVSAQFDLTRATVCELLAEMTADAATTKMQAISLIAKYYGATKHAVMALCAPSQNEGEHITPEEIAAKLAEIQAGTWKPGAKPWTDRERMQRMGKVTHDVDTRQFSITGCGERAAYREV